MKSNVQRAYDFTKVEAEYFSRLYLENDWRQTARNLIPQIVSRTGLALRQVGLLAPAPRMDNGEFFIGWFDYETDISPQIIGNDEVVTVLDLDGTPQVKKEFSAFSHNEISRYGFEYFWIRQTDTLRQSHCWSFSKEQFQALENEPILKGVFQNTSTKKAFIPKVTRLPSLDPEAVYFGLQTLDEEMTLPLRPDNDSKWTVKSVTEDQIASKAFVDFSFEDLKMLMNAFWFQGALTEP